MSGGGIPRFCWVVALGLVVIVAPACNAFPVAPVRDALVEEPDDAPWPRLFVEDVDTVAIDVQDPLGREIRGLEVEWQSTDEAVLTVKEVPASESATFERKLTVQLRAEVHARAHGTATVRVRVAHPAFASDSLSVEVVVEEKWIQVSAGVAHTCGITIHHELYCWGTGRIGDGTQSGRPRPSLIDRGDAYSDVTSGDGHTCGLLEDGRARCWGRNAYGAVGNGDPSDQLTPVGVSGGITFRSVVAGIAFVCGVSEGLERTGYCWGDNIDFQLGDAGIFHDAPFPEDFDTCVFMHYPCSLSPRPVQNRDFETDPLLALGPGRDHTCGVSTGGETLCWGRGTAELGSLTEVLTDPRDSLVPDRVVIPGPPAFETVTSGIHHTCALTSGGEAYCWGLNQYGQLGAGPGPFENCQGEVDCSTTPQAVLTMQRFQAIVAGENTTCGLLVDFSGIECWGSNEHGELGTAEPLGTCNAGTQCRPRPGPVALPGDPRIVSVAVGHRHACAATERGAAYCWGEVGLKLGRSDVPPGAATVGPGRIDEPF